METLLTTILRAFDAHFEDTPNDGRTLDAHKVAETLGVTYDDISDIVYAAHVDEQPNGDVYDLLERFISDGVYNAQTVYMDGIDGDDVDEMLYDWYSEIAARTYATLPDILEWASKQGRDVYLSDAFREATDMEQLARAAYFRWMSDVASNFAAALGALFNALNEAEEN